MGLLDGFMDWWDTWLHGGSPIPGTDNPISDLTGGWTDWIGGGDGGIPDPEDYGPSWSVDVEGELEKRRQQYQHYLDELAALYAGMPAAPDISAQRGGISDLIGILQAGPNQWMPEAEAYASRLMGFDNPQQWQWYLQNKLGLEGLRPREEFATDEEYQAYLEENAPDMFQKYRQMAYSPEERAALEKQGRQEVRAMRQEQQKQFEAMTGATGSWVRGMATYDEYNRQIADVRLRRDLDIMGQEFARAMQMMEADSKQYAAVVMAGQASVSDYIQQRQTGVMAALEGYYKSAGLAMQEYGMQLQSIVTQAELIQKTAMLELGIDESILSQMADEFEMAMAPFYAELEAWSVQFAEDQADMDNLLSGISAGLGPISLLAGGFSVICTELHRQGLLSGRLYAADSAYGRKMHPLVLYGYRWWAEPLALKMRSSPRLTKAVAALAIPWAEEMAHRMGTRERGNLLGKLLLWTGVPICYLLGVIRREI